MIIELGNHSAHRGIDDAPKLTTIHIPEADSEGLGGYTHDPGGMRVKDFKDELADAIINRNGITRLPDHEALLAVVSAWPSQAREKPTWVNVVEHPGVTPKGHRDDIQGWLEEFWGIKKAEKPVNVEDWYWTKFGAPGQGGPIVPDLKALFTNVGRVQQANNYAGGQVGLAGTGTAATATTLTTGTAMTLNQFAGYRVYAYNGTNIVWGNILSNTTGGVLTVDRWYNAATPGGAAATTPASGWYYQIADGGGVSGWFVGLTTTNITPAAGDTSLSGEYTTAGGGFIRKIAPYALTQGTSPVTFTLTPVYTGNGSDTYPSTFYAIGVFTSMVVGAGLSMKFETSLNASATVAASGDQITVTETITGS